MIASANPTCLGVTVLRTDLTCYYDTLLRILKITNAADTVIPVNTLVSFTVDSF